MDEPSHSLELPPQKEPANVFGMMGAPHYSAALARYPHTLDNLTFKVLVRKKSAQKQLLTFAANADIHDRPGTCSGAPFLGRALHDAARNAFRPPRS